MKEMENKTIAESTGAIGGTGVAEASNNTKRNTHSNMLCKGLKNIALLSARNPFEMIVAILILTSFSYFHLTKTLINTPTETTTTRTFPLSGYNASSIYVYTDTNRTNHHSTSSLPTLDNNMAILQQFILTSYKGQDMTTKEALLSVYEFQHAIEHMDDDITPSIHDFCYRTNDNTTDCFVKSPLNYWNDDINLLNADKDVKSTIQRHQDKENNTYFLSNNNNYADRIILSYAFDASQYDHIIQWEHKIATLGRISLFSSSAFDGKDNLILRLTLIVKNITNHITNLYQSSNVIDLIMISGGYILMTSTLVTLFLNMKTMGSCFTLGSAVILNGIFALILGLLTTNTLNIDITTSMLIEALPFLVITIGFERHVKYTRTILFQVTRSALCSSNSVTLLLARDCFTEIIIFCLGAKTGIPGLREFCLLSAILLAYDFVLLFTWYTAVLALKLEVLCDVSYRKNN